MPAPRIAAIQPEATVECTISNNLYDFTGRLIRPARKASVLPETIFMNPLDGPNPMVSPATPGTAVPPIVFTAPPTPEDFDQPRTEPENPVRQPQPRDQSPSQQRPTGQGTNQGRADVRIQWSN